MERLISEEERIRRAEDVLERRKNTNLRISGDNFGKEVQNTKIKKMLIQILMCLIIYCGIYYVRFSSNESLKNFRVEVNKVLKYDVDFKKIYMDINVKYQNFYQNFNKKEIEQPNDIDEVEKNNDNEGNNIENTETQEELQNESSSNNEEMGIGGSQENLTDIVNSTLTDEGVMIADSEFIKNNYNIINPLNSGIITSRFGNREASDIVSANHKGIDLGAPTGTGIIAAMDGIVLEASSKGDFGKHIKIRTGDITVIYAHCSELLVKEGDIVKQGQNIAKVGKTGKATGPHLHFEIRRLDRAINPEYLLQF